MKLTSIFAIATGLTVAAGSVFAGEDATLSIDGEVFVTNAAAPAHAENISTRCSLAGCSARMKLKHYRWMTLITHHLFSLNKQKSCLKPQMGSEGKACASCHESPEAFAGLFVLKCHA